MRYIVTGAAGFIGSHLVERLIADGHEIVAIDCFTDYYDPRLKDENSARFDVHRIDLAQDELPKAEVDGVFHLAGQPGVLSFGDVFPLYLRRNVLASQRVFEWGARLGARVVFASSSSVYGEADAYPITEETEPRPISPYGITKLACENLARAYVRGFRLDAVVLRYFTVYGPRQRPDMFMARAVHSLVTNEPFELRGDGGQSRSFTYIADAIEATIAAMERAPSSAVYNVGGSDETSVLEAIAQLERIAGRSLKLRGVSATPGDVRRTKADTRRIHSDLGWEPRTSLAEGLQAQWAWTAARAMAA